MMSTTTTTITTLIPFAAKAASSSSRKRSLPFNADNVVTKHRRDAKDVVVEPNLKKIRKSYMSILPDRMLSSSSSSSSSLSSSGSCSDDESIINDTECRSPDSIVQSILKSQNKNVKIRSCQVMEDFFLPPTAEEIACYDHDILNAIRNQDMTKIQEFHQQGRPLKCSNKYGESLLHLAIRRGFLNVVKYLIIDAKVPLNIMDDYGRNPFHDACWTHETNFQIIDMMIDLCPDLLYVKDKRGNTPLSYVRKEKWNQWNTYLYTKSAQTLMPKSF